VAGLASLDRPALARSSTCPGVPTSPSDRSRPVERLVSRDRRRTGSCLGVALSQNAANMCQSEAYVHDGIGDPNVHATDHGHSLMARAFEKLLRVRP
jgi:hypothetical protein